MDWNIIKSPPNLGGKEVIFVNGGLYQLDHCTYICQTTWFKRFPEIVWENDFDKIKKIIENNIHQD